ncbi:uncharacterized protein [Dermacentor andersoni]|uniref:uncharacterized protein n=1 Tax=Dermacentor andersoni TaxID=34620 RepID=UPI0021559B99|nr:uncharacterized protein LOC126526396 [Dermacentor andersoni]
MAGPGYPANDTLAPSGLELATSNRSCLADLEGVKAWDTGAAIQQSLPCAQSENRTCCTPKHVSSWNKLLSNARMELRQTVRGGLSLMSFAQPFLPCSKEQVLQPAALVHKLLTTHRCLTTLDIDTDSFKGSEARLCDALQGNRSISVLKINFSTFTVHKDICSVIPSLVNLKEIECMTACECPVQFCGALAKLLRTTTQLTALRIPKLHMNGSGAIIFLPALVENATLRELSFHSSAISEARPEHRDLFAKFLRDDKALTKLTIAAYNEVRQQSLKWVLEGLLSNTALAHVTLEDFIVDADSADIMTKVLAHNRALRTLNISILTYDAWMSRVGGSTTSCQIDFDPWLSAIAQNKTLEALTLPLRIWEPERWEDLFDHLSTRERHLKLTIKGHCSERHLWEKLCCALRRSGVEEHVSFDTTLYILDKHEMLECKGFSKFHSFPYQDNHGEVSQTFRRLSTFAHVISAHLEVWIPDVDEALSSDIAHYIASTTTLKELHLTIWIRHLFPEAAKIGWAVILESLRRNTSVNELRVVARSTNGPEIQLLADALNASRSIRRAHVRIGEPEVAAVFIRRLHAGIECNRNLLRMTVDGCVLSRSRVDTVWFAVCDATRRNSDLVTQAAQFVSGTLVDRYGAEALERIVEYPTLLEELTQLLSVTDAEAKGLVRAGLKSIQCLDGFMRVTGVVKDRVSCHRHEDGHMQLDDLNEDCWSLVRRHLKVEDVREPGATVLEDQPFPVKAAA